MIAAGAADQLWAGRWCLVAARAAEPGKQIDVVSNQYGVAAGIRILQRNDRWREMNETCDRCGPAVGRRTE
jgi:hypothetical protein